MKKATLRPGSFDVHNPPNRKYMVHAFLETGLLEKMRVWRAPTEGLGASPLTTRRVRASVYEGTSPLTVHTVDPHTADRSCNPYI
jgi:hypothetical protein